MECNERVQLADSVVTFVINQQTGDSTATQVLQYFFDNHNNLVEVFCLSLPARTNVYHQVFTYDNNDNLVRYVNQLWKNSQWFDDLINTRTYDPNGLIIFEVFQRIDASGEFGPYQRHFYHYQENVISDYLRQVKDVNGNWYDLSHHFYVYDSMGRLTMLYGQYINDGPVFWERTANYGPDSRVSERYLRILRYNPVLKMNVLTNTTYQIYDYNIFGNVSEVYNYSWLNDQWTHTSTNVYYNSMLKNQKVSICHKGQSICVSINALKAHLEHGDKLGPCIDNGETGNKEDHNMGKANYPHNDKNIFIVYPNPGKDRISIRFDKNNNPYSKGYLFSSEGMVLKSFDTKGRTEVTIDISGLREGSYLLKILKKNGFDSQVVLKK